MILPTVLRPATQSMSVVLLCGWRAGAAATRGADQISRSCTSSARQRLQQRPGSNDAREAATSSPQHAPCARPSHQRHQVSRCCKRVDALQQLQLLWDIVRITSLAWAEPHPPTQRHTPSFPDAYHHPSCVCKLTRFGAVDWLQVACACWHAVRRLCGTARTTRGGCAAAPAVAVFLASC